MTIRRLAEEQPASFAFTPENRAWCEGQIAKYPPGRQASAVLALLWRAQAQHGYWLPKPAIELVAKMLDLAFIRVLEIATFYSMFNLEPVGRHFIQMCGTTPCVLAGSDAIKTILERRVGEQRSVTPDGLFAWAEVECLGACCNAPMVQINDDYYEDLTPENFETLLDDLAAGRPVMKGSQIGRVSSEPVGGLTSLTSLYGVDGRSGPQCAPSARAPAPNASAASDNLHAHDAVRTEPAQDRMKANQALSPGKPRESILDVQGRTEVDLESDGAAHSAGGPHSERDTKGR